MHFLVERNYLLILEEMGFSEVEIKSRIKKRLFLATMFFVLIFSSMLFFKHWVVFIAACLFAFVVYKSDYLGLKQAYSRFTFRRELEAAKFMQLLAPILYEDGGKATLYAVLSRLLIRVDESLQRSLFQFMNEISSKPNDITPFLDFAKRTSNQDMFLNFMIALYDYQNSTADVSVIKELSEMANDTMLGKVNEVITIKNSRVDGVFNQVAIGFTIYLIPFLICLIIYKLKESNIF